MPEITDLLYGVMRDVVRLIPYVMAAVGVVILSIALAGLVNKLIRWVVRAGNLEEVVKGVIPGGLRISIASLLIMISDIGIALLALTIVVRLIAFATSGVYTDLIVYMTRVVSIAIMLLILMVALDILVKSVAFERKVESLLFILLFFFGLSMIIDLTGLSPEMKSSLGWGIAIGIGLSLGVFTLWFLFGEAIERRGCTQSV